MAAFDVSGDYTVTVEEWEAIAKRTLPAPAFDYVASGSGAEETLAKNTDAFRRWDIIPKVLTDVSERDLSVQLLNEKLETPLMLAPVGFQTIVHPDGELAAAGGAAELKIPFVSSTVSSFSLEEISAEINGQAPCYFQLYWPADDNLAASFVARAEAAGYAGIVVTVDTPLLGWREKDMHHRYFPIETGAGIANFLNDPVFQATYNQDGKLHGNEQIPAIKRILLRQNLTWDRLAWLRKQTTLPIILKGIMDEEDALLALDYGVDGIIVSNHGGRQLDGTGSALEALALIANKIQGRIPLLVDGGIRRGPDIIKALALGADAVLIGRPYIYGLTEGKQGVKAILTSLLKDLDTSLAITGRTHISSINRSVVRQYQGFK
ncbi:alpha-hydroxy-acid oxidizing protein [Salipaludibacillus agaradhaerens]|uniref:alpha-hydroxy-acid oxidizing protein n=1 Tax=Salipaludibacillus agaradhaerens TaxID=76935 RepID=UPI0021508632|nr:alpha-hydroxy-acid oxidizing protein [Salipaludibacillus agaradhaerens]MCR6120337.1 alpha-hydroxy-acid oxidizing protein [Salipaludibacillus agaradhaerens]UJW59350.1 alpha-hydroxy-acid oxidizing protein [Bacillus sp. A116_S68]